MITGAGSHRSLDLVIFIAILLAVFAVVNECRTAEGRAPSCDEKTEDIRTQLRLRTAELTVTRGQLRVALRKLEACGEAAQ